MFLRIAVLIIVGLVYLPWLTTGRSLSAGDWPYLFAENIRSFLWTPEIRFLWLAPYYQIVTKIVVQYLGVPWNIAEKVLWFLPFVLISVAAGYTAFRSWISVLIYSTSTYILMVVGGGQMGVGMAYAISPLVFSLLSHLLNYLFTTTVSWRELIKKSVVCMLMLWLEVMFDPRITLLTVFSGVFVSLQFFKMAVLRSSGRYILAAGLAIPAVVLTFHWYWILPLLTSHGSAIARQLSDVSQGTLQFLSFASFSQTISFLHPNWPENIFGKVYFMKSEFLVIPIVAFSSLFWVNRVIHVKINSSVKPDHKKILYFALLGLVGAFLAKGTQEPFGIVYVWLFQYVPGFTLFRDPTKFYVVIALSYAVLIPLSLELYADTLKNKLPHARSLVTGLFVLYWVFTIRPAVLHTLNGTFAPQGIPEEYILLKDFLFKDLTLYNTIWLPNRQRFGFVSDIHPGVDAVDLSGSANLTENIQWVSEEKTRALLKKDTIRYVIVPFDSRGELYLTDRVYDEHVYERTLTNVKQISWLKPVPGFGRIGVFEIQ
jgi:hypothetical protein